MTERFKRFLLIFMMLALPVQTFASAAMLGCDMSATPRQVQIVMAPMDHGMDHDMDHDMAQDMDHGKGGCHDAPDEMPGAQPDEHQCNHCTACYLAAAFPIPASGTTFVAPVPYIPHLQPDDPLSGFIPEGPERPPRTTLA